jgi:glycosyltransferase involved in cell wall biosynthesis
MSKKEPLVSVLLSIYKVEAYLEECLDSILAQSYTNLEIICVNNGSPDRCGEILKRYENKDKRIKIVTLKENRMVCGGRNAGLDNATGDFVCFVDPDDWIEKDYIKAMVDAILTKKDANGHFYNCIMNTSIKHFTMQNNNNQLLNHRKTSGGSRPSKIIIKMSCGK